mgnify:CR=1 FL=1
MKSPSGFLWKNPWKKETLLTYYYSAIFRMQLLLLPPGKLRKGWGRENEESAQIVGKVCDKTPWESKCLVRALAAQRLLCRRGLSSTLYLGCGMEEGKMVAHAWLRFGEMYVTGGDGGGYTTVARFCKEASGKRG